MNKIALITGATSGIGKATTIKLAELGYNLIITGRRADRLNELSKEISKKYTVSIKSLQFDVRNYKEVEFAINSLESPWKEISLLINNAGLALGATPIQKGLVEDWDQMLDTNVKGLLYISKMIMPIMIERQSGHIVNIGSIAGKEVYLNGNVYCASKFAVDAISKGMRADLLPHGIKVTCISPGMVETEFSNVRFKGDDAAAKKVYEGLIPLIGEDIADAIAYVVSRPNHVNINEMSITPTAQASVYYNHRTL